MKYRIVGPIGAGEYTRWQVETGHIHIEYGEWVSDDIVFVSYNITDCYTWVKAKQEGLIWD